MPSHRRTSTSLIERIRITTAVSRSGCFWAATVTGSGTNYSLRGCAPGKTLNALELIAAKEALRSVPNGASVTIATILDYLRYGLLALSHKGKHKYKRLYARFMNGVARNQELWRSLEWEVSRLRVDAERLSKQAHAACRAIAESPTGPSVNPILVHNARTSILTEIPLGATSNTNLFAGPLPHAITCHSGTTITSEATNPDDAANPEVSVLSISTEKSKGPGAQRAQANEVVAQEGSKETGESTNVSIAGISINAGNNECCQGLSPIRRKGQPAGTRVGIGPAVERSAGTVKDRKESY